MTFSDFAKTLFPYCRGKKSHSEFVVLLVDMIMEEPQSEEDKRDSQNDDYNPLSSLMPDTLSKIYSGKCSISKNKGII